MLVRWSLDQLDTFIRVAVTRIFFSVIILEEIFSWRGGISKKKCKRYKCHPKMNLCKFHPNWTMWKYSKLGEKLEIDWRMDWCGEPTLQPKDFVTFFLKRNFNTEFEISFVSTLDISSYMQSEQPRISGKHLTRLVKNSMAAVTCIATLLCGPQVFGRSANAAAVAGFPGLHINNYERSNEFLRTI